MERAVSSVARTSCVSQRLSVDGVAAEAALSEVQRTTGTERSRGRGGRVEDKTQHRERLGACSWAYVTSLAHINLRKL